MFASQINQLSNKIVSKFDESKRKLQMEKAIKKNTEEKTVSVINCVYDYDDCL